MIAKGGTALDDALATVLEKKSVSDSAFNRAIILISDGHDSVSQKPNRKQVIEDWKQRARQDRQFTFGLKEDYNKEYLQKLAEISGGEHCHLNDAEELEATTQKIARIACHHSILRFEQRVRGTDRNFTMSVPQGCIQAAEEKVNLLRHLTFNDQLYDLERALSAEEAGKYGAMFTAEQKIEEQPAN